MFLVILKKIFKIRLNEIKQSQLIKEWKYIHKGPITCLKVNIALNTLFSGSTDSIIRMWELEHHACIAYFEINDGVIGILDFWQTNLFFVSADHGTIYCYDAIKRRQVQKYSVHCSKVTGICFEDSKKYVISVGRDKVLIVWDFEKKLKLKDIPLFQNVESIILIPKWQTILELSLDKQSVNCILAAEDGLLHVWDVLKAKVIFSQEKPSNVTAVKPIQKLLYHQNLQNLLTIDHEQTILIKNTKTFKTLKEFCGFIDEILDVTFVGELSQFIAVATNSSDFKIYDCDTMKCSIVRGHSDIVMCLASKKNLLVTGSKDNTVRLWCVENLALVTCLGVGHTHISAVMSVTISNKSLNFVCSVGQDNSLKFWSVLKDELECLYTSICHENLPNSVTVSPNDEIIATASRDKTVKLWSPKLELLSILRGHKRSVTCVRFANVEPILLTSSGDCTIKIWSSVNFACIKTFEAFESAVLRADFLHNDGQIFATASDGLCKIFNVQSCESMLTLEGHEGRVYGLALNHDDSRIVTGCSAAILIKWVDKTQEKRDESYMAYEKRVLQEQELENLLKQNQLVEALKKSISLDKPLQALKIFRVVLNQKSGELKDFLADHLIDEEKEILLNFVTVWNTNTKNCQVAQLVLNVLLGEMQSGKLKVSKTTLESLLPYTERHFKRLCKLSQDLQFFNYVLDCIE